MTGRTTSSKWITSGLTIMPWRRFRLASRHHPQVRSRIEYKESDPRARCLFGNVGETASFCQFVNADNLGVTLDIGHALYTGERPAQAAALLGQGPWLFYVHLMTMMVGLGHAPWRLPYVGIRRTFLLEARIRPRLVPASMSFPRRSISRSRHSVRCDDDPKRSE